MFKILRNATNYGGMIKLMDAAMDNGGSSADDKGLFDLIDDEEDGDGASAGDNGGAADDPNKGDGAATGDDGGDGGAAAAPDGDTYKDDSTDSLLDGDGASDDGGAASGDKYTADQLTALAKDLELLDDANAGVKTIDELKTSFKAKLDASRKVVNLDEYSPAARRIVSLLESGMGEDAIFSNDKIVEANTIISMDDREKVYESKVLSLEAAGLKTEEAEAKAQEIIGAMSEEVIKGEAEKINGIARSIREAEIERMHNEHNAHVESVNKQNAEKIKMEKQALLDEIENTKEFMGIKIGEKSKIAMKKAIEDGTFERTLRSNQAKTLVEAYLMSTVGKSILNQFDKAIKEAGEKNMIAGMKRVIKNIAPDGKQRSESVVQGGGTDSNVRVPWAE